MLAGGWGVVEVTPQHHQVLDVVKVHINTKLGAAHGNFEILEVRQQVVAGTNYFFKLKSDDKIIEVKVFEPLPHTGNPAEVTAVAYV